MNWKNIVELKSTDENVSKFVFTKEDAAAEAVLYKYPTFFDRTVICYSVQTGCNVGCSFCFPGDSKISMNDFSLKEIKDIEIGDKIIGNCLSANSNPVTDYATKYNRVGEVINKFERDYDGDMYVITTEKGREISSTPEHPFAIKGEVSRTKFEEAKNLKVGDNLFTHDDFVNGDLEESKIWRMGWVSGFMDGDGVTRRRKDKGKTRECLVAQKNNGLLQYFSDICKELNIRTSKIWDIGYDCSRLSIGDAALNFAENIFKENECYEEFKIGFLAGFWDAEGYSFIHNHMYRVCTKDRKVLEKVGGYINDLGYNFKIVKIDREIDSSKPVHENVKFKIKKSYIHVLDSNIGRCLFSQKFNPKHWKKEYLIDGQRMKNLSRIDKVAKIEVKKYLGKVYNIETTDKTYYSNNFLVHNCGAGKRFVRSLTSDEIVAQVDHLLESTGENPHEIKRLQLMGMSCGEPMHNFENVKEALEKLSQKYPNAALLISTSAPKMKGVYNKFTYLSKRIPQIGLQFSVHESTNEARRKLIPTKTMSLDEIAATGEAWYRYVGRKPFFNYCVHEGNNSQEDADRLRKLFDPKIWECTISVICEKDETVAQSVERQEKIAKEFSGKMLQEGFNVRVFNPSGQDDIGGGCGQLFHLQKWHKEYKEKVKVKNK